jgi:hypothetical protein
MLKAQKGYTDAEQMARDAYVILHDMILEVLAARQVYQFGSAEFLDSPRMADLSNPKAGGRIDRICHVPFR